MNEKVYIAGPIAKPSKKKGRYGKNIVPAMNAWANLWSAGYIPHCPHLSYFLENHLIKEWGVGLSHSEWMEQDYAWLLECDAVLRLPGDSVGADLEEAFARKNDIPVFYTITELQAALG